MLLIVLVRCLHWPYLAATIIAFLLVNLVSYLLARRLVFAETRRGMKTGLAYYILIAALSGAMLTALMWVLVGVLHVNYVASRIVAAGAAGIGGYLLNLVFNFRLARSSLRQTDERSKP